MFVSPMLLHKVDKPFDNESYITELKLDGIRMILSKFNNKIKLYTRHNNEVTSIFPELTNINIPDGTILDGELIVPDELGKPDFEAVMQRFQSKHSNHFVQYCVFDLIYLKDEKVTHFPLIERKLLLEKILPADNDHIVPVKWILGYGNAYFDLVRQKALEGIVLKSKDSKYCIDKRSHDWLKVINYQFTDVLVTGYRKDDFGLLLSFKDGKPAGIMEFMPPNERKKFYSMCKVQSQSNKFKFIEPIPIHIKYRNLTKAHKLRIPSFVEWL